MQTLAGILALMGGVIFPLSMVFWLNARLRRKPAPGSGQVGLLLTLNFVLPVALIISGLALLYPRLWSNELLRPALVAAWGAVVIILVSLAVLRLAGRDQQGQGHHGR